MSSFLHLDPKSQLKLLTKWFYDTLFYLLYKAIWKRFFAWKGWIGLKFCATKLKKAMGQCNFDIAQAIWEAKEFFQHPLAHIAWMILQFVAETFIAIEVLPFIFIMLNIIHIAKIIRLYHRIGITDPDQIISLTNNFGWFFSSIVLFLDLISLYNDKIYYIEVISLVA